MGKHEENEALKLCMKQLKLWMKDHGEDINTKEAIEKAKLAISQAGNELAWLIEIATPEGAKWFSPARNFTNDPNDVIRFSRKCDAEAIISILGLSDFDAFTTDHMWMDLESV